MSLEKSRRFLDFAPDQKATDAAANIIKTGKVLYENSFSDLAEAKAHWGKIGQQLKPFCEASWQLLSQIRRKEPVLDNLYPITFLDHDYLLGLDFPEIRLLQSPTVAELISNIAYKVSIGKPKLSQPYVADHMLDVRTSPYTTAKIDVTITVLGNDYQLSRTVMCYLRGFLSPSIEQFQAVSRIEQDYNTDEVLEKIEAEARSYYGPEVSETEYPESPSDASPTVPLTQHKPEEDSSAESNQQSETEANTEPETPPSPEPIPDPVVLARTESGLETGCTLDWENIESFMAIAHSEIIDRLLSQGIKNISYEPAMSIKVKRFMAATQEQFDESNSVHQKFKEVRVSPGKVLQDYVVQIEPKCTWNRDDVTYFVTRGEQTIEHQGTALTLPRYVFSIVLIVRSNSKHYEAEFIRDFDVFAEYDDKQDLWQVRTALLQEQEHLAAEKKYFLDAWKERKEYGKRIQARRMAHPFSGGLPGSGKRNS